MPSLPNPIAGLSVCLDDNRLYIIGGYNLDENVGCNAVAYLQSGSDNWVSVQPMNIAPKYRRVCVLDHIIYVLGIDDLEYNRNSLESYNPITDTWELLLSNIDTTISRNSKLRAFEGKIYFEGREGCYCYDILQKEITSRNCEMPSRMLIPQLNRDGNW